jgi:5-methylcytosine-specific restriction endonuclease McrA
MGVTARVCSVYGCTNLVARGRCEKHDTSGAHSPLGSRNHGGISPSRRGHGAEYQQVRSMLLTDGVLCAWGCGRVATTADYAVPFSQGGTLDSLVPSCQPCNSRRGQAIRA